MFPYTKLDLFPRAIQERVKERENSNSFAELKVSCLLFTHQLQISTEKKLQKHIYSQHQFNKLHSKKILVMNYSD